MSTGSIQVSELKFEIDRLKTIRHKGNGNTRTKRRRRIENLQIRVDSLLKRVDLELPTLIQEPGKKTCIPLVLRDKGSMSLIGTKGPDGVWKYLRKKEK